MGFARMVWSWFSILIYHYRATFVIGFDQFPPLHDTTWAPMCAVVCHCSWFFCFHHCHCIWLFSLDGGGHQHAQTVEKNELHDEGCQAEKRWEKSFHCHVTVRPRLNGNSRSDTFYSMASAARTAFMLQIRISKSLATPHTDYCLTVYGQFPKCCERSPFWNRTSWFEIIWKCGLSIW